jgi:LasA protease
VTEHPLGLGSGRRLSRRAGALGAGLASVLLAVLACTQSGASVNLGSITPVGETTPVWLQSVPAGQPTVTLPPSTPPVPGVPTPTVRATQDISQSPTPNPTRAGLSARQAVVQYTVQAGDYLTKIGERFGVSAAEIAAANGIAVTDQIYPGQVLRIPLPAASAAGSDFKILPDSDFVYGPGSVGFNLEAFIQAYGGYLAHYTQDVPGIDLDGSSQARTMSGAEVIQTVAQTYSLDPRLLLALLDYQSGWVRQSQPVSTTLSYPMGDTTPGREGLFLQLTGAARRLNYGYYAWRAGGILSLSLADGSVKLIAPGLNPGTVGVQAYFAGLLGRADWEKAVAAQGFNQDYQVLFGNPFRDAVEPLVPDNLVQPVLQLPFEPGKVWSFTGGPHAAWDAGSAWAAIDFAPPGNALGCVSSDEWVVASAPGLVVRTGDGAVVVDLDGDGYEQTGWVLFYMHVETRDRVAVGTQLKAGDRIGHPSCEGGISQGTHTHFARKYNGEWIAADGSIPFVLDGWVSHGLGTEYDGTLTRGTTTLEACDCRGPDNQISRP